jgi:hypothetical protein
MRPNVLTSLDLQSATTLQAARGERMVPGENSLAIFVPQQKNPLFVTP